MQADDFFPEDEHPPQVDRDAFTFLCRWADALSATEECRSDEREDHPDLTDQEEKLLAAQPHALDYKFTDEQKALLRDNGYLVVKGVVPPEVCDRMVEELFARAKALAGIDRDDHSTWNTLIDEGGFIDIWHNPAYYEIRQNPLIYSIFAQLLREPYLTVSLDRACLKPPGYVEVGQGAQKRRVEFPQDDFPVHTDMNLWDIRKPQYQGGIALNDCGPGGGGFICIPGFHKVARIRKYREDYESGKLTGSGPLPPQSRAFQWFFDAQAIDNDLIEVPMQKGDFVVWNSRLPHANAINKSSNWRIQCYVRMFPAVEASQVKTHKKGSGAQTEEEKERDDYREETEDEKSARYRAEIKQCAATGVKPRHYSTGFTGTNPVHAEWEVPLHTKPELSWLGERLLGEKVWDEAFLAL